VSGDALDFLTRAFIDIAATETTMKTAQGTLGIILTITFSIGPYSFVVVPAPRTYLATPGSSCSKQFALTIFIHTLHGHATNHRHTLLRTPTLAITIDLTIYLILSD
jgi:hypothetical protein